MTPIARKLEAASGTATTSVALVVFTLVMSAVESLTAAMAMVLVTTVVMASLDGGAQGAACPASSAFP
jgi:hypothetical protein